jgi:UDP-GlcNAc:undecaprenyl-phosphate GlcNAc-1-phosphate transferase
MLYGLAVTAGMVSLLVSNLALTQSLALVGSFTIILALIGVYLSKVKVYEDSREAEAAQGSAVFAFLVDVSYKRRIFEVFLDAFLITLSYYAAYTLLQGPIEGTPNWELFMMSLPLLVVMKLAAFLFSGVYRGLWRYTSVGDLITFAKGVVLGSILSVLAILLLFRFQNFSRAVFVLDAVFMMLALVGSRMAFRLIRQVLPYRPSGGGRNVLIYGAGDAGEMILRELRNNTSWDLLPIGFIDDDPFKTNKVIHGLRVYDANGSLADVARSRDVSEILIAIRDMPADRLKELRTICRESNIALKRAQITIEPVDFE